MSLELLFCFCFVFFFNSELICRDTAMLGDQRNLNDDGGDLTGR